MSILIFELEGLVWLKRKSRDALVFSAIAGNRYNNRYSKLT